MDPQVQVWCGGAARGCYGFGGGRDTVSRSGGPEACASARPGGLLPNYAGSRRRPLLTESVFSAGTDRHELTSWKSFPSIFKFFTEASEAKTSSLKPALTRRSHRIKHEEL